MIVFLTAGNICDTFACPLCSCPLRQEFLGSREELIGDNLDQLWLLCGSRISDVMPDKDLAETRYSERVEVKAWLKVEKLVIGHGLLFRWLQHRSGDRRARSRKWSPKRSKLLRLFCAHRRRVKYVDNPKCWWTCCYREVT